MFSLFVTRYRLVTRILKSSNFSYEVMIKMIVFGYIYRCVVAINFVTDSLIFILRVH